MAASLATGKAVQRVLAYRPLAARSRGGTITRAVFVATDLVLIWLSAAVIIWLRIGSGAIAYVERNGAFLLLFSVLVVLFGQTQSLYRGTQVRGARDEALAVMKAVGLATLVLAASIYVLHQSIVSRIAVGGTAALSAVVLVGWRRIRWHHVAKRVAAGESGRNLLLFGCHQAAREVARYLSANQQLGYVAKGFFTFDSAGWHPGELHGDEPVQILRRVEELSDLTRAEFIDELLIVLPQERETVKQVVEHARKSRISVRIVPDLYDGLVWGTPMEYLGPFPTIQVHERPMPILGFMLKRAMDAVVSALALVWLSPLFALVSIAVRLDSAGAIVYRSERIGKKGCTFTCYKFRTMIPNADAMLDELRGHNERQGLLFKMANDPRITRIGRLLRRYSLDELPQLWNVLKGDMSLVGPRPPVPGEYEQYELEHLKRLDVLPGITGLWQVEARRDPSFESYINLDNYYVDHWNIWLDLRILLKTAAVVVAGTGQ